ncbi:hypothetical protein MKX03_023859, partial [Papaver bracteatum]
MAINVEPIMAWIGAALHACGAGLMGVLGQLSNWTHFPIMLMAIVQLAGAGMQVWTKEVIRDYNFSPFILVFLRQIFSSVVLFPSTYLE